MFTFLLYIPFIGSGFITDDFVHLRFITKTSSFFFSPQPFNLYRPVVELSLAANYHLSGFHAFGYGFTNLLFHLLGVFLLFKFVLAWKGDQRIAFYSALAFTLTPKANSIAVNWISGRTDLLMAIFVLSALIAWLKWEQSGHKRYLALTFFLYLLSVLSKESAVLLPTLLFFTAGKPHSGRYRKYASIWLLPGTILALVLRSGANALMFQSNDTHYNLMTSIPIVLENTTNYFFRSLPVVIFLSLFILLPLFLFSRKKEKISWRTIASSEGLSMAFYSFLWFLVFIAPVSPIIMRSELYLYLPGAGFYIGIVWFIFKKIDKSGLSKKKITTVLVMGTTALIAVLGSFIVVKNIRAAEVSSFSYEMVKRLPEKVKITGTGDFIYLIPQDNETKQILKDSFTGYFDLIVKMIYARDDIHGRIESIDAATGNTEKREVKILYKNPGVEIKN